MMTNDPITFDKGNVLVSAGAGCGKTYTLSKRVAYFIANKNYKLDDFLILTFTNLAALEMKERIRSELKEINSPEALNVDFAKIMTFDAYALALVKKYHFKLGLESNVKNIDENVITVKKLEILEELFEEKYQKKDQDFLKLITTYCFKDDKDIMNLVLKIYHEALLEGDVNNYLENFRDKYFNNNLDYLFAGLKEAARLKVLNIINQLPFLPEITYTKRKKEEVMYRKIALDQFQNLSNLASNTLDDSNYQSLINEVATVHNLSKCYDINLEELKIPLKDKITKIKSEFKFYPLTRNELQDYLDKYRCYINPLLTLVKELDEKIMAFKKELNAYEYNDIARMASSLLKDKVILEEIKESYKMIMVDEYQDTSKIQDDFVMAISNNNLFMVGDVKQSIYRFRNARPDLFMKKYEAYKKNNDGTLINLNTSYRSRKSVIKDINEIFSKLMTSKQGGCDYQNNHELNYGQKDYDKLYLNDDKHNIELLIPQEETKLTPEIEAKLICYDILEKMHNNYQVLDKETKKGRKLLYSDIYIIMDRGTEFDTYLKVFEDYQIPVYLENDEKVSLALIPLVLTNLLRVARYKLNLIHKVDKALNPFPKKAILSLARSFIYNQSDEELIKLSQTNLIDSKIYKDIEQIVYDNQNLPLALLFETLLEKLDVNYKLYLLGDVEENSRLLEYYLDKVKEMDELGYTIDSFIKFLEVVNDKDLSLKLSPVGNKVNSVKLINIHKSKGLEAKVIYYAGLAKDFNKMDIKKNINITREVGLILPNANPNDPNILKNIYAYYETKEATSEHLRALYVALTRAREKIILVYDQELLKSDDDSTDLYFKENLMNYLNPVIKKMNLKKIEYDLKQEPQYQAPNSSVNKEELKVNETIIKSLDNSEIIFHRPSKSLDLTANKEALEYGNKLHMFMELCDFKNVQLDKIQDKLERTTIEGFLNSPLAKDINDAEIYKEYEFYDGITHGIIDLMLIYQDLIVIIDYKTKDINHKEYDVQLNTYMDFASKRFKKEVKGYLYSLKTHDYREVKRIAI